MVPNRGDEFEQAAHWELRTPSGERTARPAGDCSPNGLAQKSGRTGRCGWCDRVEDCLELGQTVTGEHGVEQRNIAGTSTELGPRVIDLHHSSKMAIDSRSTLNPGKIFPIA